jgi:hypothetical protein
MNNIRKKYCDITEETCRCEEKEKEKDFSHGDTGFEFDDREFPSSATSEHDQVSFGGKECLLLDELCNPIRCQSCNKLVVDSSATSEHDRVSFGDSATAGETSIHLNENGVPEKCAICECWVLNPIKHNWAYFPDDVKVSPYCHSDPSKTEIESCYLCGFPKIDGSVHHTDPTRPCDPSCYADGTKHLSDEKGCKIQCPECLELIRDPREHTLITLRFPDDDRQGSPFWSCSGREIYR